MEDKSPQRSPQTTTSKAKFTTKSAPLTATTTTITATMTLPKLNVTSLAKRVYDATLVPNCERVIYSNNNDNNHFNNSPTLSYTPWNDEEDMPPSYLELRRHQNDEWAYHRLQEGIALMKQQKLVESEAAYQEGLEFLCGNNNSNNNSHHNNNSLHYAPLLVAYGALCANQGRTKEGIAKLQHALEIDPSVPNAQQYLDAIEQQQQQRNNRQSINGNRKSTTTTITNTTTITLRTDKALQDAMAEQALSTQNAGDTVLAVDSQYPLLSSDNDDDDHHRKRNRKSNHHHAKKQRRRQRRQHDDSDSDNSCHSRNRDRSTSSPETKRRGKKKKKKKRRRRSPSPEKRPSKASQPT